MQQDQAKKSSFLWKKITIQTKQSLALKNSGEHSAQIKENKRNEEHQIVVCKENQNNLSEGQEDKEYYSIESKLQPRFEKIIQENSSQIQRQNTGMDQIMEEEMVESFVEKLKIDDQSNPVSQTQLSDKILNEVFVFYNKSKFKAVKQNLKQIKTEFYQFQEEILAIIRILMEEWAALSSENMKQMMKLQQRKGKNCSMTERIKQLQEQLSKKQERIWHMNQEINRLNSQNMELNEKVFDFSQKIQQWDLELERKIKSHYASFNSKTCQTQQSKSSKFHIEQIERVNDNLSEINEKIEKLQAGELKIMDELQKIHQRSNTPSKSFKLPKFQRKQQSSQNSMEAKYSIDLGEATTFRNQSHAYQKEQESYSQMNKHNSKSFTGLSQKNNTSIQLIKEMGKKKQQKLGSCQRLKSHFKVNNLGSQFFIKQPQTPKNHTKVYINGGKISACGNSSKISFTKNEVSTNRSPRHNQSDFLPGFFYRPFNPQSPKVTQLGIKINQLRNQIRNEINQSK